MSAKARAMSHIAGAALAAILCALTAAPAAAEDWLHYVNPRFGVSADIPSWLFTADPPENGDGQRWTDRSDGGTIAVYGAYQVVADDIAGYRAYTLAAARTRGIDLTYERHGPGWFVYSGFDGETIVYERVESGCEGAIVVAIRFEYPADSKRRWDPIVRRGASSLAPPLAEACP